MGKTGISILFCYQKNQEIKIVCDVMYKLLSYVQLFALCTTVMYFALCTTTVMYNSWIVACQDLISMEFSRQKYWSGLPFPSPRDLPDSGIEQGSPALQVDFYHLSHQGNPNSILESLKLYSPSGHLIYLYIFCWYVW